jgi:hypothetical protein
MGCSRSRRSDPFIKMLDKLPNLIPNSTVMAHGLVLVPGGFRQSGRIVEADMNDLRFAREYRTGFMRGIANRDNVIERHAIEFFDVLGMLAADIDARFEHHLDRQLVHSMRFNARGVGFNALAF